MQAIRTRYIGPTNHHGARYSAQCDAGRIVVVAVQELDVPANHEHAAQALAQRLGWLDNGRRMVGGSLPGNDYAWVFTS